MLGGIAVAIMTLILLVLFDVRWRLLPLAVILVGVVWAFGLAGYLGGWFDLVVQRLIEVLQSLPTIPLWLALAALVGGKAMAAFRALAPAPGGVAVVGAPALEHACRAGAAGTVHDDLFY